MIQQEDMEYLLKICWGIEKSRRRKKCRYGSFLEIPTFHIYFKPNCQNATALAAATFKESTPCDIGMRTV